MVISRVEANAENGVPTDEEAQRKKKIYFLYYIYAELDKKKIMHKITFY